MVTPRTAARFAVAGPVSLLCVACAIWTAPDPRCEAVPQRECLDVIEEALGSVSEEDRDEAGVLWVRPTTVASCNANDTPLYDAAVEFTPGGGAYITTVGHTPTGHLVVCTY